MQPYMPKFTAPKAPPKEEYRLGLSSLAFRGNTQREILEAMRALDLRYIEWASDPHAPYRSCGMLSELSKLQAQYGVSCSSYRTAFRLGETPTSDLHYYIEAARTLGTDVISLWGGRSCAKTLSLYEMDNFMEACWRAADIAEKENVKLSLECHANTFTERLEDALMLMDNVDSDKFRIHWQPFRFLSAEENLKYLKKAESFVEHIRVFNSSPDGAHALSLDIPAWQCYLAKLTHPRLLLIEQTPDRLLTSLGAEVEALREIVK